MIFGVIVKRSNAHAVQHAVLTILDVLWYSSFPPEKILFLLLLSPPRAMIESTSTNFLLH